MEGQQQHQQPNKDDGSGKARFISRQMSSRWIPTTDHIRILKELYYNDSVRSLSDDHIKKISAQLRQYGKVEGKNVFYWFKNHKAHQRQKERLTTTEPVVPMHKPSLGNGRWKYPTSSNGVSPTTSASSGSVVVRQTLFERRKQIDLENGKEEVEENEEEVKTPELETLPLFPMHGEDINGFCSIKFLASSDKFDTTLYRTSEESESHISLELSLSSDSGRFLNEPQ